MYANKTLSVNDINTYLIEIFMYQCIYQEVLEIFLFLFQTNDDVHDYDTRQSQQLHVPYGRLDVRGFSFKVHGAHVGNTIPDHIKNVQTIHTFKQLFRNYVTAFVQLYQDATMIYSATVLLNSPMLCQSH